MISNTGAATAVAGELIHQNVDLQVKILKKKPNLKSNFVEIIKIIRFARPHSMLRQDLNKKSKARELKFLKI